MIDQLPTFFPSFLYYPYEAETEKVEAEEEVKEVEDETVKEGSAEEDLDDNIVDKINEEIQAIPEEFERLKEEWTKSNDSTGPHPTFFNTFISIINN